MEEICKLKYTLPTSEAILMDMEVEKVRSNVIIEIDKNSEFFTTISTVKAIPTKFCFYSTELEPISQHSINNISQTIQHINNCNKSQLEMYQSRLEHQLNIFPYAIMSYNSISKTNGFTPHELAFGHTSSRPPEIISKINTNEILSIAFLIFILLSVERNHFIKPVNSFISTLQLQNNSKKKQQ